MVHRCSNSGRPGGNRTPNLRFWRPPLCQLSYWPVFGCFNHDLDLRYRTRECHHPDLENASKPAVTLRTLTRRSWRPRRRLPYGHPRGSQTADPLPSQSGLSAINLHLDVVSQASPSQLHPAAQPRTRHVRRTKIKLRTISLEKRRVSSALFLRSVHIDFRLKLRMRRNRTHAQPVPGLAQSPLASYHAAIRPTLSPA